MKLKSRSFPHPVLGNGDDVQNAALQVSFDAASDKKNYYLKCHFECSSQTLCDLIAQGRAAYVTHVECSNTVFRTRYVAAETTQAHSIGNEKLNGNVEVNFFICATTAISNYRIAGAHPDYGDSVFSINKGDILATADGKTFTAEKDTTALRRVSSIMQIEESKVDGDAPMELIFDQNKIRIVLSKPDFDDYKILKGQEQLQSALSAAIVLPALIEARHIVGEGGDDYSRYRWHQNLKHRIEELGIGTDDNFVIAQKLLELPLRRALQQAKSFGLNSI